VLRAFPSALIPVRLPFGAWWLAGHGVLDDHVLGGDFESAELRFAERYLQPGMTVLDIGAHHGLYSVLAARRVGANGIVRSFEPSPRERRFLQRNLEINRFRNVRVEPFALGSEAGSAELHVVTDGEDGCNSLRAPVGVKTQKVAVAVKVLDEYLRESGLEGADFIKLDVEGAELGVLRGAKSLLSSARRPVILAEVQDVRTKPWGYPAAEIIRLLESQGYQWHDIMEDGSLKPLDTTASEYDGNFVAWPEERKKGTDLFQETIANLDQGQRP